MNDEHGGAKVVGDHGGHKNGKNLAKFNACTKIIGSRFNTLNDINHEETSIMNYIDYIMIDNNNIMGTSRQ